MYSSPTLIWRAALLSLGIHAVGFAFLVGMPILPRFRSQDGGVVQLRLVSPPPAALVAAVPTPPTAVVAPPEPPPAAVTPPPPPVPNQPPPPKHRPRPVVIAKPPPAPRPPDPPRPPPLVPAATPAPPQAAAPSPAPASVASATGEPVAPAASSNHSAATPRAGAVGPGADTIAELVRHLQAQRRYPAQARRRGIEGTVGLAFRVAENGDLLAAEVRHPSGSDLLDNAALRTLKRAFPLPRHLARGVAGEELTINLAFRLVDR